MHGDGSFASFEDLKRQKNRPRASTVHLPCIHTYGEHILTFQFHLEVNPEIIGTWAVAYDDELEEFASMPLENCWIRPGKFGMAQSNMCSSFWKTWAK
ncbi:MAG: hypothetical protein ACYC2T_08865 [Bacillota bacterium]